MFLLLLVAAGFSFSPVRAQGPPVTPFLPRAGADLSLGTSVGAQNTGVDIIQISESCFLSAAVMDGNDGGLYWSDQGSSTNLLFANMGFPALVGLKDPDVVLSLVKFQGQTMDDSIVIVATIVGISPVDNHVYAFNCHYNCNGEVATFQSPRRICKLGFAVAPHLEVPPAPDPGNSSYLTNDSYQLMTRRCYSPNVDANKDGKVVITWAEEAQVAYGAVYDAWMQSLLGLSQPAATQLVKVGSVMSAEGLASDTSSCYQGACPAYSINYAFSLGGSSDTTRMMGLANGDCISKIGESESEAATSMWPDVTISEGNPAIVIYVFTRRTNRPVIPNLDRWTITVQKDFGECNWTGSGTPSRAAPSLGHSFKDDWAPVISMKHRIASHRADGLSNSEKFMFVGSAYGGYFSECEAANPGVLGPVLGYGAHGSNLYFSGVPLNQYQNITAMAQWEPAIAKVNEEEFPHYTVGWSINGQIGVPNQTLWNAIDNSASWEIISSVYGEDGSKPNDQYSFINNDAVSLAQQSVSVAQAKGESESPNRVRTAFAWLDHSNTPDIALVIKETGDLPSVSSVTGYDLSQSCEIPCQLSSERKQVESFKVNSQVIYPVPVLAGEWLKFRNTPTGYSYSLYSSMGKPVQNGSVSPEGIQISKSITPGQYLLRVNAKNGVKHHKLIIK